MPIAPIDFLEAADGSPERRIFDMVKAALKLQAYDAFVNDALTNAFAADETLTSAQRVAIRAAVRSLPNEGSGDNINRVLRFTLYAGFALAAVSEDIAALSTAQRESILAAIYDTAKSVVEAQAADTNAKLAWEYAAPEWELIEGEDA